ncbi:LOW QUALITY PROTEIN: hypothetical protein HID58_086545, partial [Brassica napus]
TRLALSMGTEMTRKVEVEKVKGRLQDRLMKRLAASAKQRRSDKLLKLRRIVKQLKQRNKLNKSKNRQFSSNIKIQYVLVLSLLDMDPDRTTSLTSDELSGTLQNSDSRSDWAL